MWTACDLSNPFSRHFQFKIERKCRSAYCFYRFFVFFSFFRFIHWIAFTFISFGLQCVCFCPYHIFIYMYVVFGCLYNLIPCPYYLLFATQCRFEPTKPMQKCTQTECKHLEQLRREKEKVRMEKNRNKMKRKNGIGTQAKIEN